MDYDVVIIGAGPAGLCLAKAFADQSLKVAVVERQPADAIAEPAFDGREIALTHASVRLLTRLGVWRHIAGEEVSALRHAQVMTGDSPAQLRIDSSLTDKPQLGYLVPNHLIRRAAWQALQEANDVTLHTEARVAAVSTDEREACVTLHDGTLLHGALLVAADSRFSQTRRAMGIGAEQQDFGKHMLVCRMSHEAEHGQVAWEWFGHGQTLALLPLREHLASVVLTVTEPEAQRLHALDEAAFAQEMRERFGGRLGAMRLESTRHLYPLIGVYARRFVGRRFALAGDAAVGMHPVTAHGFNLGLASVERLADMTATARAEGLDLAAPSLLARYERRHRAGTLPLYLATRAIVGVFTDDRPLMRHARQAGLALVARLRPFRRAVAATLADEGPVDASWTQRLRKGLAHLRPGSG
ncbi:5-demethoxyubiquinol-8 5-hydroxylase UbiM [Pseudoxanthomonas mexicana]|uniref:5-demethoxyubiquinol-8 5-hydroxylase UbiM n=1 Tax=Pseudoxanthomonas mexicana TaxID=128785 RepID=UPI00398B76B7